MNINASLPITPREIGRALAWLALFATWITVLFAFRENVLLVVESWEKLPSHAHGYVVLLVVAYFFWKKLPFIDAVPFSPSLVGITAFLLVALAALVGELVSAAVVVQFSTVFLIIAAVWAIMGYRAFRTLVGPLSFLLFAIPFGHDALPTLMDWTADATVAALRLSGIPVFQQDRHFIIPSGSWAVVEACAGIRYMFTAFFIGTIYAYITYQSWVKRIVFVSAMLGLSLFANWLRAYTIVLVAHLTNNEWGLGLSHLTLGWIIFGVVVFIAFWIGNYWQEHCLIPPTEKSAAATPKLQTALTASLIASLALAFPQITYTLANNAGNHAGAPILNFEGSLHGLEKAEARHALIVPLYFGATATHQRTYRLGDADVLLEVAYYRNQSQGKELINVNNQLEPSKTWNWTGHRYFEIPGIPIAKLHAEKYSQPNTVALATTIYWVGGMSTQSAMQSKLLQAFNLLIGRGDDGAAIIVTASAANESEAQQALQTFIQQHFNGLLRDLDQSRQTP